MTGRAVAGLAVVVAALGAAVWWTGPGRAPSGDADAGRARIVPEPDAIRRITIDAPGGRLDLRLDPDTDRFRFGADGPGEVDPDAVRRLLRSLHEHRVVRALPDADPAVARPTTHRLEFEHRAGPSGSWAFGGLAPTGGGRYAIAGSGEVALVEAGILDRLDRAGELVRLRRPLDGIAPDRVRRMRLRDAEGTEIVLVRNDDTWRLTAPVEDRADAAAVSGALRALVALAVPEVRPGEVPGASGLDVELVTPDGAVTLRWSRTSGGEIAVGRVGADWHGAIAPAPDAPWRRDVDAWRDRNVVPGSLADVDTLTIRDDRGTVVHVDVGAGTVVEGDRRAPLDRGAARDAVERLGVARASDYADPERVGRTAVTLELGSAEGGPVERIDLGVVGPDGLRAVRVAGRPGVVLLVEDEALGGSWTFERFAAGAGGAG